MILNRAFLRRLYIILTRQSLRICLKVTVLFKKKIRSIPLPLFAPASSMSIIATPISLRRDSTESQAPLSPERADSFESFLARLPERDCDWEWYTPNDIAQLFDLSPAAVRYHVRLVLKKQGKKFIGRQEFRLNFETARAVTKRIYFHRYELKRATQNARPVRRVIRPTSRSFA